MSDTPSGYPKPIDGKPYDSEAPTQLWQSPFRNLSQFPNRRAARRRERLEALLKGQEITSTGVLSSTNLTHTAATEDVSPAPLDEAGSPEAMPPPDSLPTGTYTSIRPVSGPRMAVFIAVGVAVGGLAALQLNRVLTPLAVAKSDVVTAIAPPVVVQPAAAVPGPVGAPLATFEPESCVTEEPKSAIVPPLRVEVVSVRSGTRTARPAPVALATGTSPAAGEQSAAAPLSGEFAPLVNSELSNQACSRYPTVHIPTQLHPRVNPLMTSSQVFREENATKSNGPLPNR